MSQLIQKLSKRWKELREGIQWDDQTKLLASACFSTVLLLAALLLPLAFRDTDAARIAEESERDAALRAAAKANLFAAYWGGEHAELTVKRLHPPGQQIQDFCETFMAGLVKRSITDYALRDVSVAGSEYLSVSDGETEVKLCRMWQQSTGDWRNWIDVCFDAESGAVYYYYLSRECLSNGRLYELEPEDRPTVATVAEGLAAELNARLRDLQSTEKTEGTAVLATTVGTLVYEIDCVYYDVLLDIKAVLV